MPQITAKIIADSISYLTGTRLTTMELSYHRFIHSEFMTHRVFSRNASSSRAIPTKTLLAQVENDPMLPLYWGGNKAGMQAGEELTGDDLHSAQHVWLEHAKETVKQVKLLDNIHLHKQIANRLLEPFLPIKVVVTSTEWANFFALRDHKDAQPEIQELAKCMKQAMNDSTPAVISAGDWHLPYVSEDEIKTFNETVLQRMSAARCARVSYLNHDKSNCTMEGDIALFDMLATRPFDDGKGHILAADDPVHLSPLEHQATPMNVHGWSGNLRNWKQFRQLL